VGVSEGFSVIFSRLKAILEPYTGEMVVVHDTDEVFYLDTRHVMTNGKPLYFASVHVRKNYVSFYLMLVYAFPDLLDDIGDLKRRMQGKSCFNFRTLGDDQVARLTELTRAGYERYRAEGMLG
jgi:hypothetical protein